jgi:cell pole-organizing protein PopZ
MFHVERKETEMKAICISACEIPGVGIVQAGDEVKLHDGFYNDPRIRTHFHIVESSVKDKNAKPPDMMAEADARRERFAKSLADHTAQIIALNKLGDAGGELPRELAEPDGEDAPTEQERVAKIVELWCDNFGYEFPTDERKRPQGEEKPAKKPGKGKKERPPESGEEAQAGGEKGEGESEDGFAEKDKGRSAEDAQQSLFDKLNGNP